MKALGDQVGTRSEWSKFLLNLEFLTRRFSDSVTTVGEEGGQPCERNVLDIGCTGSQARLRGRPIYRHGAYVKTRTHETCSNEGKVSPGARGLRHGLERRLFGRNLECLTDLR